MWKGAGFNNGICMINNSYCTIGGTIKKNNMVGVDGGGGLCGSGAGINGKCRITNSYCMFHSIDDQYNGSIFGMFNQFNQQMNTTTENCYATNKLTISSNLNNFGKNDWIRGSGLNSLTIGYPILNAFKNYPFVGSQYMTNTDKPRFYKNSIFSENGEIIKINFNNELIEGKYKDEMFHSENTKYVYIDNIWNVNKIKFNGRWFIGTYSEELFNSANTYYKYNIETKQWEWSIKWNLARSFLYSAILFISQIIITLAILFVLAIVFF